MRTRFGSFGETVGKNFVFDKREAVSAGDWNGDGGVVTKKSKAAKNHRYYNKLNNSNTGRGM